MVKYVMIPLLLVLVGLMGCSTTSRTMVLSADTKVSAKFREESGKEPIILTPDDVGGAPRAVAKDVLVLERRVSQEGSKFKLEIAVSKDRRATGGLFDDRDVPLIFESGPDKYIITIGDIPEPLPNNRFLRFRAGTEGGDDMTTFYLRHIRRWQWSGISAPILFRVTGDAAEFQLSNLAPSLATGVRHNFLSDRFPFVAANLLLTVFPTSTAEGESQNYSLATGAVADIAGYLQVGFTYQFKDENSYLVIGIRPEYYAMLFGAGD